MSEVIISLIKETSVSSLPYFLISSFLLSGCLVSSGRSSSASGRSSVVNSPNSVSEGYGRILQANPIVLSGNPNLDENVNLATLLKTSQDFVTNNDRLFTSCSGNGSTGIIESCIEVRQDANTIFALTPTQKKWAFSPGKTEFDQVNTFGHIQKMVIDTIHPLFLDIFKTRAQPSVAPPLNYQTAIPQALYDSKAYWDGGSTLLGYANCEDPDNAHFDPSNFSVCLGYIVKYPQVKINHDPSVIYHELGHATSKVIHNFRNIASGIVERAENRYLAYDEAGAINEGLGDYFSYIMNGRSQFGEWGLGRFLNAARPLDETSSLHAPGIGTDVDSRLRYPDFIGYETNSPNEPLEDIHGAGQVFSHFLTSFTRDLQTTCSMTFKQATDMVMHILIESYAEYGDMTSAGSDHSGGTNTTTSYVNHRSETDALGVRISEDWFSKVNPLNYRSFFQKFGKYTYQILNKNSSTRCNGTSYPMDQFEALLDSYGLLLFKTYNENGNNYLTGQIGSNKKVNDANRLRSVLISKDFIKLDPRPENAKFFVYDKRADILAAVAGLKQSGNISQISELIPSQLEYNNGNGELSPGEIVGILPNLYNDSNSIMAGVQILANDWDHTDGTSTRKPCNNFEDAFPLASEGGVSSSACSNITKTNGNSSLLPIEVDEAIHPVCFVQMTENGATVWSSQDALRIDRGLEATLCLGGSSSRHDCYIRAIRGADSAVYSRIDPKKNWGETFSGQTPHSVLFFEINPNTPPGTTFDCRFRVRFSNCKECYTDQNNVDGDDWRDFEYSGGAPFKIIHYQFQVVN